MSEVFPPIPLPWQQHEWELMLRTHREGRLPHALLVAGAEGLGKRRFVDALAASLLCSSVDMHGTPCGECRGCDLCRAGTHPDLIKIEPEEPGKGILIDAIREFTSKESLTAQAGGYKIVVIEPADAMNIPAANSLLKTLEEPTDSTFIVLISAQPGRLPATIRSRCRLLQMRVPEPDMARKWLDGQVNGLDSTLLLAMTSGAPLKALVLADAQLLELRVKLLSDFAAIVEGKADPVAVAAAWSKLDQSLLLRWYSGWLIDALRLKTDPGHKELINPDQRKLLQGIGMSLEFKRLFGYIDDAYRAISALGSQLNQQMLIEGLLLPLAGGHSGKLG